MNDVVSQLGIQSWKPFLTLMALPPVPFLLLTLVGARLLLVRRGVGWILVLISVVGIWVSTCNGFALLVSDLVLRPPQALSDLQIARLRAEIKAGSPVAIVVLGGGRELLAPEYGLPNLTETSLARLRYGEWLARQTGAPIGFSGGVGWAQPDTVSEAEVAGRVATQEFDHPLRWIDTRSRDTRENATFMMNQLRPTGVKKILLVTHGWHMPRAVRDFESVSRSTGADVEIVAAPMGLSRRADSPAFDWLPTPDGFGKTRAVLREVLARILGA